MKRPLGVTLLALYCFAKAAFLLLIGVMALAGPKEASSAALLRHLIPIPTYVTSRENEFAALILVPGIGIFATIGWSLWFLRKWAWNIIMATTATTLVMWARYLLLVKPLLHDYPLSTSEVLTQMLIEGNILMYLYIVRDAFNKDQKQSAGHYDEDRWQ